MKKHSLKSVVLAACLTFGVASVAQAVPVSYTDMAIQTYAGQNFSFNIGGGSVVKSNGGNGLLTIEARGDYTVSYPHLEYLSGNIDGIVSGTAAPASGYDVVEYSYNDVQWKKDIVINGADLLAITSDMMATLNLDLSSYVDYGIGRGYDWVKYTLSYHSEVGNSNPVPEPGTMLLLGTGLAGIAAWRFKKPQA